MDDGRAPGGSVVLESCTGGKKSPQGNIKDLRCPHSRGAGKKYWELL